MFRSQRGVATRLQLGLCTHCYGHALNSACGDNQMLRDALDTAYEIIKLVKISPHRDATLHKIKQEMSERSPGIRALCPMRWTVRADALWSITSNYEFLQQLWVESQDLVKEIEMKCHE